MEIQRFPKVGVYAKSRTLVKEKKIELYTLNADIWEEPPPPSFEPSNVCECLEPIKVIYSTLLRTYKFSLHKDDVEDFLPHGSMHHSLSLSPLLATRWITKANIQHNP